jgi:FkbM family methyltransferase
MRISRFLARVLNKLRLISTFNGTTKININKKKLIIPLVGRQGYDNLNLSEPWMTETLFGLRPLFNGYFVDVGVNLGQTLLKAHAVFDEFNYIGFEPNPSCVSYVQEIIRQNRFQKAAVLPIAVGEKTEMLKLVFFVPDKNDSSATIIENFRPYSVTDHYIFVPVFDIRKLTHFLPNKPFSILKIDVEGAEMDVLVGLNEWISSYCPLILIEILPVYTVENQARLDRQNKIEELLKAWNYKIARIKKKDLVSLENIETFGIHSNIEDCDYLLYHASLNEKITTCFKFYN